MTQTRLARTVQPLVPQRPTAGHVRGHELMQVKPLVRHLASVGAVRALLEGETIFGQGAVYAQHEFLRSLYFARMVGRARGIELEVHGR